MYQKTTIQSHVTVRHSFNLSRKIGFMLFVTVFFVVVTTLATMGWIFEIDAQKQSLARIDLDMKVAWNEVQHHGSAFRLENDQLKVGEQTLNGANGLADTIAALVGGSATIFMRDTRIATNIKKEDGSRAIGTQLAKGAGLRCGLFEAIVPRRNEDIGCSLYRRV